MTAAHCGRRCRAMREPTPAARASPLRREPVAEWLLGQALQRASAPMPDIKKRGASAAFWCREAG
ncbi:hypothetical protein [Xanthomonas arboricola]|uniref:hypothetical protein n=1 Tax=Xanthomonas arboricola TaxID=56448 RepID=UPI00141BA909|nr:hypothetical protein [Xanthomonas arboricola]NIK52973.1 hypothetical protein [Xanthomonas arboricola]